MAVIDIADVRWNLRLDDASEDAQLAKLVARAAAWVEGRTGAVLEQRLVSEPFDAFGRLDLRYWPVAAAPVPVVSYLDVAGVSQAQAAYRIGRAGWRSFIVNAAGAAWPRTYTGPAPVTVTYTAGYAAAADVPQAIQQAIMVLVTAYYGDREGGDTATKAEHAAAGILDNANMRLRAL